MSSLSNSFVTSVLAVSSFAHVSARASSASVSVLSNEAMQLLSLVIMPCGSDDISNICSIFPCRKTRKPFSNTSNLPYKSNPQYLPTFSLSMLLASFTAAISAAPPSFLSVYVMPFTVIANSSSLFI